MICDLCLIKSEDPVAINSIEGKQSELVILLEKYFTFCLSDNLNFTFVCRNCWSCVENFHWFYVRIEEIHQNKVLENIGPKEVLFLKSDKYEAPLIDEAEVEAEENSEKDGSDNANSLNSCDEISNGLSLVDKIDFYFLNNLFLLSIR